MSLLEISQITYNFVLSIAVILVAIFIITAAYKATRAADSAKKFFSDVGKESSELYGKIKKLMEEALSFSFISRLFSKRNKQK